MKKKSATNPMQNKSLMAVVIVAAATFFVWLSSGATAQAAESGLARLKKAGKLIVAIDPTYPPMESEGDHGKPEGFDIDFANELATRLGVKADFMVMAWDGILAGLQSNRYDVIISSMNITDDRKKQVDFVEYVRMSQLFVAKKGVDVKTEKDLAGKVVAVGADTTSFEYVTQQQKKGTAIKEVKAFRLVPDGFVAIKVGQADVIVVDEPVGRFYAKQDPKTFLVTGRAMAPEPVGIAVSKKDSDLRDAISKAVDAMRKDGTMKKISMKWFGTELGAG